MTNKLDKNMESGALGVDIGNVIIEHRQIMGTTDETLWNEKYSSLPAVEDVFACLKELNEGKFQGNIFLVSKLKLEQDERTLKWLKDNEFFEKTGLDREKMLFCRERFEKVKLCQDNNIKYFIDDRLEILGSMVGQVPNLYLFNPDEEEVAEFKGFLSKVTRVKGWKEVMKFLENK